MIAGVRILRSAHGGRTPDELAAAAARANQTLEATGLMDMGPLFVARTRNELEDLCLGQLRSAPVESHAGGEFRFAIPMQEHRPGRPAPDANELIDAAWSFIEQQERIAAEVRSATIAVEQAVRAGRRSGISVELAAIGVLFAGAAEYQLIAEIRTLGEDLQPGIARLHLDAKQPIEATLASELRLHSIRSALLEALASEDADYWLDGVAARIIETIEIDIDTGVRLLAGERSCQFHHGGPEGDDIQMELKWLDGVLTGSFNETVKQVSFGDGILEIPPRALPDTVLTAAAGQRLDRVISHALLPPDSLITKAVDRGHSLEFRLSIPATPTRLANGGFARAGADREGGHRT